MRPDLVVHVGLGAASTLLQSALPLLEPELTRQGVRVAAAGTAPTVGTAPLLVTAPAPPAPADPSDAWAFCSLQRDEVAAVITRSGASRVRILLSPERQDRLLERSYRAAVADGFAGTFQQRYPRCTEPVVDFGPVAGELSSLPGVLDLRVVPLELVAAGQATYVGALLDALECARPIDLRPLATWQIPVECSPRGMRIARAMAPHLDTDDERAKVRDYVLSAFPVPVGAAPHVIGPDLRLDVVRAYRPANREFLARFAPDLPATSYGKRGGLDTLASTLTPVDLTPAPPDVTPPAGLPAVRARLGLLRRRLLG